MRHATWIQPCRQNGRILLQYRPQSPFLKVANARGSALTYHPTKLTHRNRTVNPSHASSTDALVVVAQRFTPTEAHILRGCLEAAGIPATVSDANLVQADNWLTTAIGGVRVNVPQAFLAQARTVIDALEAGQLDLDADADLPSATASAPPSRHDVALWNPDAAAFFSLLLTPLFGATLHFLNSRQLGDDAQSLKARLALAAGALVTFGALYVGLSHEVSVRNTLAASGMVAFYTLLWYVFIGHGQSKLVSIRYGTRYRKMSLWVPVLIALALLLSPSVAQHILTSPRGLL